MCVIVNVERHCSCHMFINQSRNRMFELERSFIMNYCVEQLFSAYCNCSSPLSYVRRWQAQRPKTFLAVLLLLCYSHTCRTTSVVVELTYAGVILTSAPSVDVELIGKEGWRTWERVVTRRGDYNFVKYLLIGIDSGTVSSGSSVWRTGDLSLGLNGPFSSRKEIQFSARAHTHTHTHTYTQ
jgi:hypothetical protein